MSILYFYLKKELITFEGLQMFTEAAEFERSKALLDWVFCGKSWWIDSETELVVAK